MLFLPLGLGAEFAPHQQNPTLCDHTVTPPIRAPDSIRIWSSNHWCRPQSEHVFVTPSPWFPWLYRTPLILRLLVHTLFCMLWQVLCKCFTCIDPEFKFFPFNLTLCLWGARICSFISNVSFVSNILLEIEQVLGECLMTCLLDKLGKLNLISKFCFPAPLLLPRWFPLGGWELLHYPLALKRDRINISCHPWQRRWRRCLYFVLIYFAALLKEITITSFSLKVLHCLFDSRACHFKYVSKAKLLFTWKWILMDLK